VVVAAQRQIEPALPSAARAAQGVYQRCQRGAAIAPLRITLCARRALSVVSRKAAARRPRGTIARPGTCYRAAGTKGGLANC